MKYLVKKTHYSTLKSLFISFTIVLFFPAYSTAQKILIVNNQALTNQNDGVYQSIDQALEAANEGDILHIIPSPASYGDITLDKSLSLYGIGINDQNHPIQTTLGSITIANTNEQIIKDVSISGLNFGDLIIQNATENLQVKANRFGRIIHNSGTCKDAYFIHNIFERFSFTQSDNQNVVVANNVINVSFTGSNAQSSQASSQILLFNNLFLSNANSVNAFLPAFRELNAVVMQGNIFYGVSPNSSTITNSLIQNNSSFRSSRPDFPTSTNGNSVINNIENVDPQFVNLPLLSFWQFTFDASLNANSPLKNAGTDGSDMGPLAGYYPWNPSQSPLPFIENIDIEVQPDNTLRIKVKAKKN